MTNEQQRAQSLGWMSIGLGLMGVVAPQGIERFLGIHDRRQLLRGVGLRELVTGVGILAQRKPTAWVWARVAGDVMDVALLLAGRQQDRVQRSRIAGAAGVVLAVGLVDLACARQLSSR